jgi:histidyl-tRNA synthetase
MSERNKLVPRLPGTRARIPDKNALPKAVPPVPGTRDETPDKYELRQKIWRIISTVFERYGYRGVEVPTIELMELHLRKSGEQIRKHMYYFEDLGRKELCLRPELTASVARMYSSDLREEALPLRLYYLGSAFRFDRPQKGRYREFTQAGIELIGGKSAEFDAEVIAAACDVMDALRISKYEVVIGNMEIIFQLLVRNQIEERAKHYILERLEAVSKTEAATQAESLEKWKAETLSGFRHIGIDLEAASSERTELLDIVREFGEERTTKVIGYALQSKYDSFADGREANEIATSLVTQLRRHEQGKRIVDTIEFICKLMSIRGKNTDESLMQAEELLSSYGMSANAISELRGMLNYLRSYDVNWDKIKVDFGFGRGLEYYTGIIFEIYVDSTELGSSQKQVCGGGRYDTLISALSGEDEMTPALGFSFGLERLALCVENLPKIECRTDAFVAPIGGEAEFCRSLTVAHYLRGKGLRVDIGLKGMGGRDLTGMARRLKSPYTVFIGETELQGDFVTLKNMLTGTQVQCTLEQTATSILGGNKQ